MSKLKVPLALILLTLAAYLPALRGGFIWDDNDYVTQNANLRDAAGLGRIWTDPHSDWQYYPLVFTSFWAEYQAWGLAPQGYHLDNVLLHAVSAILLWRLLTVLQIPAAALAAAIFAVHPVEVESVAWVTERKNVLCGVFYLAAMLVYFNRKGRWAYLASLALFACAMFSKTVAATWPAALLVIVWWKNGRLKRQDVFPMIPFVVIGFALGLLTTQLEAEQVGAVGSHWNFSAADRSIIAGRAIWFYAAKAVLPLRLAFIYPKWDLERWRAAGMILACSAVLIVMALVVLQRRLGRGPAAAGLLFAGTLLPALGFINVYPMRYTYVADHYQYLAIIALIVPAAVLMRRFAGRYAVVVLIPLFVLTWRQCEIYHDPITLWTDTVARNSRSWMTHVNLGQAWQAENQLDRAEEQYRLATEVEPDEADAWWKLGGFQAAQGRYAEAEANLRHALRINPDHPGARKDLQTLARHER